MQATDCDPRGKRLLRRKASFVLLLLPVRSAMCEAASEAAEPANGDALFEMIIQEQLKQLAKMPSIEFFSFQRDKGFIEGGIEHESTNEWHIIRSGDRGWSELTLRWREGREGSWKEETERFVWNERYVASWVKSSPFCEMYGFGSPEGLSDRARRRIQGGNPRPELSSILGLNGRTLAEIAADPEKYPARFEVQRTVPESRYLVKMIGFELPHPSVEWIINPAHGFIIEHCVYRNERTGRITKECEVTAREVAPGIWFPSHWTESHFEEPKPDSEKPRITGSFEWELKEITVDPDVPVSKFEWPALGLDPTTQVLRTDSAGQPTKMNIKDGQLVPF